MSARTLSVMLGGQYLFQALPGGMVVFPTTETERADVIHALRSALKNLDQSSSDSRSAPGDTINRHIAHEAHEIVAPIQAVPISAE